MGKERRYLGANVLYPIEIILVLTQARLLQVKIVIVIIRATTKKKKNRIKEMTRELKQNTRKNVFSTKENSKGEGEREKAMAYR